MAGAAIAVFRPARPSAPPRRHGRAIRAGDDAPPPATTPGVLQVRYPTRHAPRRVKAAVRLGEFLRSGKAVLEVTEAPDAPYARQLHGSPPRRRIKRAFDWLRERRTTFIIAHRLSTVADADEILVFDARRFVERGRFKALARGKGLFARMVAEDGFTVPETPETRVCVR